MSRRVVSRWALMPRWARWIGWRLGLTYPPPSAAIIADLVATAQTVYAACERSQERASTASAPATVGNAPSRTPENAGE